QAARPQTGPVQALPAQIAIDHAQGGKPTALLPPMAIEDLDRDIRMLGDLFEQPTGAGLVQHPALSLIGAASRQEGVEAALLVGVPPILQGAHGVVVSVLVSP